MRDMAAAVNALRQRRPGMALLIITHYRVSVGWLPASGVNMCWLSASGEYVLAACMPLLARAPSEVQLPRER